MFYEAHLVYGRQADPCQEPVSGASADLLSSYHLRIDAAMHGLHLDMQLFRCNPWLACKGDRAHLIMQLVYVLWKYAADDVDK